MVNCIYISKDRDINAYQFMQELINNHIHHDSLIEIKNYISCETGFFIYKNKPHRIWFNIIKDNVNYIIVTEM